MSFVKTIFDHRALVRNVGFDLEHLADAARTLGQDRLADTIFDCVQALNASAEHVLYEHGAMLSENLSEQHKQFGSTIRTLLGVPDEA